jgi:hypothetical protein
MSTGLLNWREPFSSKKTHFLGATPLTDPPRTWKLLGIPRLTEPSIAFVPALHVDFRSDGPKHQRGQLVMADAGLTQALDRESGLGWSATIPYLCYWE